MFKVGDLVVLKNTGDPVQIIGYEPVPEGAQVEAFIVRRPDAGQSGLTYHQDTFFKFELCTLKQFLARKIKEAQLQKKMQKRLTGTPDVAQQI
jgi:hypothetical protein